MRQILFAVNTGVLTRLVHTHLGAFFNLTIFKPKPLRNCFFDIGKSDFCPFPDQVSHYPNRLLWQTRHSCTLPSSSASAVVRTMSLLQKLMTWRSTCQVYTNSLLATLNARKMIRGSGDNIHSTSDNFSLSLRELPKNGNIASRVTNPGNLFLCETAQLM